MVVQSRISSSTILRRVFFLFLVSLVGCLDKTSLPETAEQPAAASPPSQPVPVRVVRTATGYELQRNGKPYFVKGVGGTNRYGQVRAAGGNSIRLWTTDYARPLLDSAQAHGLTVLLGLFLAPEWDGFDYYDKKAVAKQKAALRQEILRYRNHPALLAWDVGNEIDQGASNPEVFDAINEAAQMIHALDPNHPVLTTLADPAMLRWMNNRCPDLDIVGFNSYAGLAGLPSYLRQIRWQRPYLITEFGPRGYWEAGQTTWQAPLELPSTQKAAFVTVRYQAGIARQRSQCLGSYVFYWGQRQEATPTWFSMFTSTGERTELVDQMQYLWRGTRPANRVPQISEVHLNHRLAYDNVRLRPNQRYSAFVTTQDQEHDSLRIRWEVRAESRWRQDFKKLPVRDEPLPDAVLAPNQLRTTIRTPTKPGAYRLYVTVSDNQGGAATANFPFYVEAGQ